MNPATVAAEHKFPTYEETRGSLRSYAQASRIRDRRRVVGCDDRVEARWSRPGQFGGCTAGSTSRPEGDSAGNDAGDGSGDAGGRQGDDGNDATG
jgi:hypothetical protein